MKNKTVLITGASMGIGKATAVTLSKYGINVILNYCNHRKEAEEIANRINKNGLQSVAIQADVSNKIQVINMVNQACEIFGKIDALVNNAGIAQQKLFTDISEEEWDKMFAINVKGAYNCCQAVLPSMIHNKFGKIINVSSIWGLVGASCEVHYSASKAAIIGFTKALAKEVGPSGIQVNCVAPGVIETNMLADFSDEDLKNLSDETPLCKLGTPQDVANVIKFLISDESDFITGQVISPNGGFVI